MSTDAKMSLSNWVNAKHLEKPGVTKYNEPRLLQCAESLLTHPKPRVVQTCVKAHLGNHKRFLVCTTLMETYLIARVSLFLRPLWKVMFTADAAQAMAAALAVKYICVHIPDRKKDPYLSDEVGVRLVCSPRLESVSRVGKIDMIRTRSRTHAAFTQKSTSSYAVP